MKRMVMVMLAVVGCLVGAGAAVAAPLSGMQAWAAKVGTNAVVSQVTFYGLTNAADRAAVAATWDEGVLVDTALRERAYGLIVSAMTRDKLTPANMERVKVAVLAETVVRDDVFALVVRYPVAEREQFRTVVEAAGAARYAKQPAFGRMMVKYTILRGGTIYGPEVGEEDLVRFLLAPEGMTLGSADNCKKAIKERAVALARMKLRAEGKSFVVKDGVNPLVIMVQSVVTALNAQECTGLEAALRNLGSAIQDMDRKPMRDLVAGWQPKLMSGEMGPGEVNEALGKIAVTLGPDAYNRFVDGYNNGTAGVK